MRYGVLADVHGNLPALRTALAALERSGVDRYLCAGDLVGYGPFPDECVELLGGVGAVTVAGNHDLIALGRLSTDRCVPVARRTLEWTRGVMAPATTAALARLPLSLALDDGVVMAHGGLDDPQRHVRTDEEADLELSRLEAAHPGSRLLLLGHTHRAAAWGRRSGRHEVRPGSPLDLAGEAFVLNPGAVGQSREPRPRARWLVLDTGRWTATFGCARYPVGQTRRALRARGLPRRAHHPWPTRATARRAARRLVRFSPRS